LRDQNSQLHANLRALKSGVPAASELEDLKNQVFQLAEEGEKRKKMEEDMREMWKKSEVRPSEERRTAGAKRQQKQHIAYLHN